jgi:UDP-N-acetylmuramoyl-L-alanyl-D-glutamate--2,6-diaminopimelate ligase
MKTLTLGEAAAASHGTLLGADRATPVGALALNAEAVLPGSLFVAIPGFKVDGHSFVGQAFERGAVGCVVENGAALQGRPGIVVESSRRAMSALAAAIQGDPSTALKVVGITGTNGKTTTNWIVYHVLNQLAGGCLRVGTLGSELLGRERIEGSLTSPDAMTLQELMAKAVSAGASSCVMEVSSHALDQLRVEDVKFDVAVFTNLTRDHLDYHETFEAYFLAKKRLFELLAGGAKKTKAAVVNVDDPHGLALVAFAREAGLHDASFGFSEEAAFRISAVRENHAGMEFEIAGREQGVTWQVQAPFIGLHNAENLAAAFASCVALGLEPAKVARALRDVPQVPGRLERVGSGTKRVFVDYAHTPDALERAIKTVKASTKGQLWVLFGCGGDRDKGKRPLMGQVAAQLADRVVVTSDNPRTEDPASIIADILSGGIKPALVQADRRAAIVDAIQQAGPNDTLLIAGKGHEDYQIIGTEKFPFSDQEIARGALS